jgi:hypothetical protein
MKQLFDKLGAEVTLNRFAPDQIIPFATMATGASRFLWFAFQSNAANYYSPINPRCPFYQHRGRALLRPTHRTGHFRFLFRCPALKPEALCLHPSVSVTGLLEKQTTEAGVAT